MCLYRKVETTGSHNCCLLSSEEPSTRIPMNANSAVKAASSCNNCPLTPKQQWEILESYYICPDGPRGTGEGLGAAVALAGAPHIPDTSSMPLLSMKYPELCCKDIRISSTLSGEQSTLSRRPVSGVGPRCSSNTPPRRIICPRTA
ncbi:hypothetical protein ENH_00068110 [Eimeria necatrix]|uniref:Uncharacterized protein n=1 Tax=Eimeria necatrix TaxID=51315 RepID=U6MYQ3_9EIME|nr:hypothetical protein ENH_00068110 [Eimeria necatrix]CDJ69377.1 hypothetical protein ENH_00068110 [Eimeria necatrix]